jgi:hypothetical protein
VSFLKLLMVQVTKKSFINLCLKIFDRTKINHFSISLVTVYSVNICLVGNLRVLFQNGNKRKTNKKN